MDKKTLALLQKKKDKKTLKNSLINAMLRRGFTPDQIRSFGIGYDKSLGSFETKRKIKEFYEKNKRLPSSCSKNKKERQLAGCMGSYCSSKSGVFDFEFKVWKNSVVSEKIDNKKLIKEFYEDNGRLPSSHSKDKKEKRLSSLVKNYTYPNSNSFDIEFKNWKDSITLDTVLISKNLIKQFHKENKRFPSCRSIDKEEKSLAKRLYNYCAPSSGTFDPEFKVWKDSITKRKDK